METMRQHGRNSSLEDTAPPPPQTHGRVKWRTEAVAAYRRSKEEERSALPTVLAARIHELTGQSVAQSTIWVDGEARTAMAAVDGVLFRLRQRTALLIRPYATSPTGYVESVPIERRSDLGRALLAWEVGCDDAVDETGDD